MQSDDTIHTPPMIIHVNIDSVKNKTATIIDCCKAFKMRKAEASLLLFYAEQQQYFTPAMNLIEKRTGLSRQTLQNARRDLEDDGLIRISHKANTIEIDWDVIRAFALIYVSGQSDNIPRQRRKENITVRQGFDKYAWMTMSPEDCASWLDGLTDKQYAEVKTTIRDFKSGNYEYEPEEKQFFEPEDFLTEEDKEALKRQADACLNIDWSQYILSDELPF